MHDGGVVVGVVVVGLGGSGIAAGVDGLFETGFVHVGGTFDHGDTGESVE